MQKKHKDERNMQIVALYEELQSMNEVAKLVGVSKGTVHNVLKKKGIDATNVRIERTEKYAKQLQVARDRNTESMLDFLNSDDLTTICRRAISKLTNQNMDFDIERYGIGNMYRIIGTFADKVLSARDYEIKLRQIRIREKELEIKEKELELRITNPDMFREIQIINDAPKHDDAYGTTNPNN